MTKWISPPADYAELMLWRVFVATCEADVWQVIERWVRNYGNPFETPVAETDAQYETRQVYQNALRYTYHNK